MAEDSKISALTGLAAVAGADEFHVIDKSDITDGSDGTSKKVTKTSLAGSVDLSDLGNVGTDTVTSGNVLMADGTDWDSKTPDTGGLVTKTGAQTLTNKTLTTPIIASLYQDAGKTKLMTVPNTASDTLAAIAATQTLTNKTLTSPVLTTPQINDTSLDHQYIFAGSELTADRTVTLPLLTGNDEFAFKAHTQVLTNKTIIQKVTSYTPDAAGTATLDVTDGGIHAIAMPAGNITIAISNEAAGQCFMIEITQDGTGSRTVTWFTTIKWAGGAAPTLTTTGGKRDTFGFRVSGADTYDGFIVGQNI